MSAVEDCPASLALQATLCVLVMASGDTRQAWQTWMSIECSKGVQRRSMHLSCHIFHLLSADLPEFSTTLTSGSLSPALKASSAASAHGPAGIWTLRWRVPGGKHRCSCLGQLAQVLGCCGVPGRAKSVAALMAGGLLAGLGQEQMEWPLV